jgi:hypothetical protein
VTLRRFVPIVFALAVLAAGPGSVPAAAGEPPGWITPLRGHLALGYSQLFVTDAPGGSISFAGGIDAPVAPSLRAGVEIGFDLLGSRTARLDSSTVVADLDYSAFEAIAMLHWQPSFPGPLGRLSVGAGLFGAKAALSSLAAAQYEHLAVAETVPGFAATATFVQRRPALVRVGFEAGVRVILVPEEWWTIAHARLAFHF